MGKLATELLDTKLVAKVKLHNYRFPKTKHNSGDFAIVILDVIRIIDGEIPEECLIKGTTSQYKITAVGNIPRLDERSEYIYEGVLTIDKQWGAQYNTEVLRLDYDLDREEDQRKFFSYFMTNNQIELLFKTLSNPIDSLRQKNIGELIKVKGIGQLTAIKMCQRYEDCKDNSRAYVVLKNLDLSKNTIDRLVSIYGSADLVVAKIESNPYILIKEVRGIGWKKADDFAKRQGMKNNCPERIVAYTQYYLEQQAEVNGNSWVTIEDLLLNVKAECEPISQAELGALLKENMMSYQEFLEYFNTKRSLAVDAVPKYTKKTLPMLYYDKATRRVGLVLLRDLEKDIAYHLHRLQNNKSKLNYDKEFCKQIIKQCEEEQGFTYTDEQVDTIWNILDNHVSILTGGAGCVDCDTEFFTGTEWKKISDYKDGDKVLIYNSDGTTSLEKPLDYIKLPCEEFWQISSRVVDQCVSDDHLMYYVNRKGKTFTELAKTFAPRLKKLKTDSSVYVPCTFNYNGKGIPLTDIEIKIMLAVICDGSFTSKNPNNNYCRFHIKKDRKKEELRKLFKEGGFSYKEFHCLEEGYVDFYFFAPKKEKIFSTEWYNCSNHQLKLICENIIKWDGHYTKSNTRQFSTTIKENADFIQFAFCSCGQRANIYTCNRKNTSIKKAKNKIYKYKSIEYRVNISYNNKVQFPSLCNKNSIIERTPSVDGYKYCFRVKTGLWVARRNNKIAILHNCGKSSTLTPLIRIFEYYNLKIEQCALSGRASSLLNEITKVSGKTIHRLLAFSADTDSFKCNEYHPLGADVVILDETSMVGGELFLSLVSAIKNGAKFIMLGDTNQLESIGLANILRDCISSGYIKTNILTKIHRQAALSGIITQSLQVCSGSSIVKTNFSGSEIRGELKDFKITGASDSTLVQQYILNEFKSLYFDKRVGIDNLQVIVPMKTRGDISCRVLNGLIQDIVNPKKYANSIVVPFVENGIKYEVCFKPHDKIIVVKNNYHAEGLDGSEKQIFNGNIGYIKDIAEDFIIITLQEVGDVVLRRDQWNQIQLAYAITVHKKQGDSVPFAIVGLDTSAYALLSRELLYTAITRASKFCSLIVQPKAANMAVKTSRVKTKQTWLKDDLQEYNSKK